MDLLSMLANAVLVDLEGDPIGEVLAIHIYQGRLKLTVDVELEEVDDPDDGAKDDIPDDDASNVVRSLRAVGTKFKDGPDG